MRAYLPLLCLVSCLLARPAHAIEGCDRLPDSPFGSLLHAVPTPAGAAPVIDGRFDDWDLRAMETVWPDRASAPRQNAQVAFMYDARALYFAAHVSLPGRPYHNEGTIDDGYQLGDLVQMRLVSDPGLGFPLAPDDPSFRASHRVFHWTAFRNTPAGRTHMVLQAGSFDTFARQDCPPGSAIVILPRARDYVLEARIPWAALGAPDGRNPFGAGRNMTAIVEISWGDGARAVTSCRKQTEPGDSVWWAPASWGQLAFEARSGASEPAAVAMRRADLALFAGQPAAAARLYREAVAKRTSATDEATRTALQAREVAQLVTSSAPDAGARAEAAARRILAQPAGTAAAALLQLQVAGRVCEATADGSERDEQLQAARRIAKGPAPAGPGAAFARYLSNRVLGLAQVLEMRRQMAEATVCQAEGRFGDAADRYAAVAAAKGLVPSAERIAQAAARLEAVSRMLARPAAGTAQAAFIGVDSTLGSAWQGVLGREAWVLAGYHGDDLCGGPKLLDHSFRYRVSVGDPKNSVRRWRDTRGGRVSLLGDLALADPTFPEAAAVSFWDDAGEDYPRCCGPDLSVDLSVPAGAHILSMPLHFSAPDETGATCAVHLLTAADGTEQPSRLCSTVVSAGQGAGYLRARIVGPLRCTLLVQRLNSLNTNVPALFLDPDPTHESQPGSLALGLSAAELAQVTGDSQSGIGEMVARQAKLLTTPGSEAEWAGLYGDAHVLSLASGLPRASRAMAAWIATVAADRSLLRAARAAEEFERCLSLAFGEEGAGSGGADARTRADSLWRIADALRQDGRLALAGLADGRAWATEQSLAIATAPTQQEAWMAAQASYRKHLWEKAARPYLADQTVWLWQGDGGPEPKPITVALGAAQVTSAARRLVEMEAAGATGRSGDPAAFRARECLNWLASEEALGPWLARSRQSEGLLAQPLAAMVYAAAGTELLGTLTDELRLPAPPASRATLCLPGDLRQAAAAKTLGSVPPAGHPCLLAVEQREQLARSMAARRLFTTDDNDDSFFAIALLQHIAHTEPGYAKLAQVHALLAGLTKPKQ